MTLSGRAVLCVASLAAACSWQPVLAATVTYSGYVVDELCFDKCVADTGCDECALDKTNVLLRPQTHTVRDILSIFLAMSWW
jgi:hypothetical protein